MSRWRFRLESRLRAATRRGCIEPRRRSASKPSGFPGGRTVSLPLATSSRPGRRLSPIRQLGGQALAHDRALEAGRLWFIPHNGRTWTHRQRTKDTARHSIRPVRPACSSAPTASCSRDGNETTIGFAGYRRRSLRRTFDERHVSLIDQGRPSRLTVRSCARTLGMSRRECNGGSHHASCIRLTGRDGPGIPHADYRPRPSRACVSRGVHDDD